MQQSKEPLQLRQMKTQEKEDKKHWQPKDHA
jgi:hypothetical protein